MDYGHDLLFGSFLTPSNRAPEEVVALAEHSEAVGLDLVTFQDHPYQPAFLDTWTLLSHVAARTSRIHLSGNVLNVPLRNPAVLARSVATLDLLSGGRVELGLGTGAFWDAMVALGVDRLTPGEAVTALGEAIDVIRGLWDTSDTSRLVVEGRHHRLAGAKRGPAPAHDVGIWLGAYKPRMLRMVGTKADGWLPSWGYLSGVGQLAKANERIDDAAASVGRAPAAIRRLLNIGGRFSGRRAPGMFAGTPQQWAEQLAELATEYGTSAFILGSDDPTDLTVFGREVAPAVRELVAGARA
ncbi:LLM class flavin-dependent oxidoreductase [Pseudactinotalea sp. HY158]|uniref:LLM class flavin-dependent oxidoreductase n=1 Tax=Pseudactinotalea sp. HY158 TaxID=2654547 RepID=UPI001E495B29|nr:LLM class flavin-dependent oxidoreductase [Pseudactinotalea sp. HY158]